MTVIDSEWLGELIKAGPLLFALGFIVSAVLALAWRFSWLNPPFIGAQEWAETLAFTCLVITLVWGGWRVKSKFWRKPAETSTQPASPAQPLEETPTQPAPPAQPSEMTLKQRLQQLQEWYGFLDDQAKNKLIEVYRSGGRDFFMYGGEVVNARWFERLRETGFLEFISYDDSLTPTQWYYEITIDAWDALEILDREGKLLDPIPPPEPPAVQRLRRLYVQSLDAQQKNKLIEVYRSGRRYFFMYGMETSARWFEKLREMEFVKFISYEDSSARTMWYYEITKDAWDVLEKFDREGKLPALAKKPQKRPRSSSG